MIYYKGQFKIRQHRLRCKKRRISGNKSKKDTKVINLKIVQSIAQICIAITSLNTVPKRI